METPSKQFNKLGGKTFQFLILKRSGFLFFVLIIFALLLGFWNFIPTAYLVIAQFVLLGLFGLFVLSGLIIIILGSLEYHHYKIWITEEMITLYRGLVSEEEIGLPFRRIKQVNIERSLFDQMMGISNLNLTVLGSEEGGKEDHILLPALDKKLAQEIQDIILQKAEVEEINVDQNKQ